MMKFFEENKLLINMSRSFHAKRYSTQLYNCHRGFVTSSYTLSIIKCVVDLFTVLHTKWTDGCEDAVGYSLFS